MREQKDLPARGKARSLNGETLLAAVRWVVDAGIFDQWKFHGNTSWNPFELVMLAVVWAWSESGTLTGAFEEAHRWSLCILGRVAVTTYQGLMGALVTSTGRMVPQLWGRMHELLEQHGGEHWRIGPWLPLAIDGSRVTTARTQANERAFCAANYGRSRMAAYRWKKNREQGRPQRRRRQRKSVPAVPQIWLTLIWHMGLRMPWSWKSGPSTASERDHFQQMLSEQPFPKNTLFCGDAGFTGYQLWKAMIDRGHHILIRVGANVRLLRKLGYYARERAGIVYCWPSAAARKNEPPLVLRLIRFRLGRGEAYVVTSVLESQLLSEREAVRLYHLRWGVELQFRASSKPSADASFARDGRIGRWSSWTGLFWDCRSFNSSPSKSKFNSATLPNNRASAWRFASSAKPSIDGIMHRPLAKHSPSD